MYQLDFDYLLFKNLGDIAEFVFEYLHSPEIEREEYDEDLLDDLFDLDGLIKELQIVKENYKKELLDREYSNQTMRNFLLYVSEKNLISELDYPYDEIFKKFVEILVEKDDNVGLDVLGYSVYGGNEFFECDFKKPRKYLSSYMLELDPSYANIGVYLLFW